MGRAPCCDKANVKKGPWSPEEDAKLKSYIEQHGTGGNWIALPQKIGLKRCGKSCRLRWLNYLRPNIKHGGFSEEEDNIICSLYISIGSRWSIIAAQLPGRTDNDIKNYWNTRLKKKLLGKHKQRKAQQQHERKGSCLKQGMITRKGHESSTAPSNHTNNQITPYWPVLPITAPTVPPYSNQLEAAGSFNDHTSIRKLLIKLGGKISDDAEHPYEQVQYGTDLDFPMINLSSTQQAYGSVPSSIEMLSSTCTDASNASTCQFPYNIGGTGVHVLRAGHSSLLAEFEEMNQMMLNNNVNPQRVDGLEFLVGDMVSNIRTCGGSTSTANGESMEWSEMGTFSYPNCEGLQQQGGMQECCTFEDMRYAGAH